MKTFPWDVFALGAVLMINRLVVPLTYARPLAFWLIQAVDVALAVGVLLYGLPGLQGYPSVGWLVAGLLAFHVLQNLSLRAQAERRRERDATDRERLRMVRGMADAPQGTEPGARPADGDPAP